MNKEIYKSAMNKVKIDPDFEKKTINLISNTKAKNNKSNKKYLYATAACAVLLLFTMLLFNNNNTIKLNRSVGNVSVKHVNRAPNINTAGDLVMLSEEEIFNKYDTSIFKGRVIDIKNIKIKIGSIIEYRAVATIDINKSLRGDEKPGDTVKVLLPCPIDTDVKVEDTNVISNLNVGSIAILMPIKYDDNSILKADNSTLYLRDISEYGLPDGERFAFIEKQSKVVYAKWAFERINENMPLDEIEKYILDTIE